MIVGGKTDRSPAFLVEARWVTVALSLSEKCLNETVSDFAATSLQGVYEEKRAGICSSYQTSSFHEEPELMGFHSAGGAGT